MKFTIKRKELKAIARFAATKDVRYYLQSVCITQNARGTVIEATNGHMLGKLRVSAEPHAEQKRVIIGSDDVAKLKGTKKNSDDWLHFTVHGQEIQVIAPDSTMTFQAVDAQFPDTDRVTPLVYMDSEVKPAHFNPEYLITFMQASEDLTGKKQIPRVIQRGEDAAVVMLPLVDEFLGVLMPVRDSVLGGTLPQWQYLPAIKETEKETI